MRTDLPRLIALEHGLVGALRTVEHAAQALHVGDIQVVDQQVRHWGIEASLNVLSVPIAGLFSGVIHQTQVDNTGIRINKNTNKQTQDSSLPRLHG
ncbi:MAG: hypothetical protein CMJ20_07615 [Phycisphaeraceae bacterium]|nr:hypothetical protein [Phycisphaeraceae bacterium]